MNSETATTASVPPTQVIIDDGSMNETPTDAAPTVHITTIDDGSMVKALTEAAPTVHVTTITATVEQQKKERKESPKGVSITLTVFAALGFLLGLTILIYSWLGLHLALTFGDKFESLQKKCYDTFDTEPLGANSGYCEIVNGKPEVAEFLCGLSTCRGDQYCSSAGTCTDCPDELCLSFSTKSFSAKSFSANSLSATCVGTTSKKCTDTNMEGENSCANRCPNVDGQRLYVCGLPQKHAGCSLDSVKDQLNVARVAGTGGAITGTVVGIGTMIVAIPVLLNGIMGLLNKEVGARITGGLAIGMSVFGFCKGFSCMIAMIAFTILAKYVNKVTDVFQKLAKTQDPCSDECYDSLNAQSQTVVHIGNYYRAMSILCGIILVLQVLQMIMASVSCCLWKRKA